MNINSLLDIDKSENFSNPSIEIKDKIKRHFINDNKKNIINNINFNNEFIKAKNKNEFKSINESENKKKINSIINDELDIGSHNKIKKNNTDIAKGKINLEESKNNNNNNINIYDLENIRNELNEVEKYKDLIKDKKNMIKNKMNKKELTNNENIKDNIKNLNISKENEKNNNNLKKDNINIYSSIKDNSEINKNLEEKNDNIKQIIENNKIKEENKEEIIKNFNNEENEEKQYDKMSDSETKENKIQNKENLKNKEDENKNKEIIRKKNEDNNKLDDNIINLVEERKIIENDIILQEKNNNKSFNNNLESYNQIMNNNKNKNEEIILKIEENEEKIGNKNNQNILNNIGKNSNYNNNPNVKNNNLKNKENNRYNDISNNEDNVNEQYTLKDQLNDNNEKDEAYIKLNKYRKNQKNKNKSDIIKKNNLIRSFVIPNISNKIGYVYPENNNLLQSQEIPSTHIILTKLNIFPDFNKDYNKYSLRRIYQRRRYKSTIIENLQILIDNCIDHEKENFYRSSSYENLYKKAKLLNKSNKRKSIPLNYISKKNNMEKFKKKLKNIILKEPIKKCRYRNNFKYIFKKWKNINNKYEDKNIIINTVIYKAEPNEENEKIYKLPSEVKINNGDHIGYYDYNIAICHQIEITIKSGIFIINTNGKINTSYYKNYYRKNIKDDNMEIFVIRDIKNRNFSLQKNVNYTFNGTY